MGIVVENPGVLTTIQDKGRYGYEQFGVSPSGPMDLESFQIANILVGNSRDLSALEATMLGPTLRFTQDNIIAVTGGDMMPLLDEKPLPMNQAVLVKAGSVLKLRAARTGCRTYVAFAGGLDVPEVMGSRATGVQNKVGGLEGRKLAKGDEISFLAPKTALPRMEARRTDHPMPAGKERVLRVILGPQDDAFTPQGIDTFLGQPYNVTTSSPTAWSPAPSRCPPPACPSSCWRSARLWAAIPRSLPLSPPTCPSSASAAPATPSASSPSPSPRPTSYGGRCSSGSTPWTRI